MQEEHVQYLALAFRQLDQIELPGVGVFVRRRIPARYDAEQGILHPPYEQFELLNDSPSSSFRDYLSQRFQLTENDAVTVIGQIAARLQADLAEHRRIEFVGIGTLEQNPEGQLQWTPVADQLEQVKVPVPLRLETACPTPPPSPHIDESPRPAPKLAEDEISPQATTPTKLTLEPRNTIRRSPIERLALILLTVLLVGILIALFVFRDRITDAIGLEESQSTELTETDTELEAELLSSEGFIVVDSLGHQKANQQPAAWSAKPGTVVYHIIVGSEVGEKRASRRLNEWQAKGYHAVLVPGPQKNMWRISIYQSTHLNECDRKLAELKLHSLVPYDTWTLKVQY